MFNAIGPALFGDSALGKVFMALLAASILTSASASTQTTILPTARTALSMGVFRALPRAFARVHPRNLTPTVATVSMGAVSAAFYLLFTWLGTNMLTALIGSIGLMIAFYYGLTGFVCAWYYRKTLWRRPRDLVMQGVVPLLGGGVMLATFGYGLKQFLDPAWLTDDAGRPITLFGYGAVGVTGLLALGLGVVLMFSWWAVDDEYFLGRTLPMGTARDLVLAGPHVESDLARMPASGLPELVIAPDLSNLPEGEVALDPVTGETFRREAGSDAPVRGPGAP